MPEITRANLPEYVESALTGAGIDTQLFANLPLAILQSGSIEISKPIQRPSDFMEGDTRRSSRAHTGCRIDRVLCTIPTGLALRLQLQQRRDLPDATVTSN